MKVMTINKSLIFIMAASLLTTSPTFAVDKDPQLDKQVNNYWSAQTKLDWASVYDLLTPKQQSSITRAQYIERRKKANAFSYSNAQIKDIEIVDDLAWVSVGFDARLLRYPDIPPKHVLNWQLWQKTDTWRLIVDEERKHYPVLPPKVRLIDEETTLAKRAKTAWESKTTQDWKSFYSFLAPAYQAIVPLNEFLQKKAQYLYSSTQVDWVEVAKADKDHGRVSVTFSIKPNDPAASKLEPQQQNMIEDWIKQNGEWYFAIPLPANKPSATPNPAQTNPVGAKS